MFQVGIPINARVLAVQNLEHLHAFMLQQLCPPAHLPYSIIENSQTSSACNPVCPNNFKLGTNTPCTVLQAISEHTDRNLHNHVFDDVIRKPPIRCGAEPNKNQ